MPQRLSIQYDRRRDVLYVSKGDGETINLPFTENEDIRLDPESYEVVGYVITNFSLLYPHLVVRLNPKQRWFVKDFFQIRLQDWNNLLSPLRGLKARINFLRREGVGLSTQLAHHH
jgi:hypothetical protein